MAEGRPASSMAPMIIRPSNKQLLLAISSREEGAGATGKDGQSEGTGGISGTSTRWHSQRLPRS